MMNIIRRMIDMNLRKYSKFPKLKRFFELGGEHTEEGEKYLIDHPKIYMDVMEWDFLQWHRVRLGDTDLIHKGYE